MEVEQAPVRYFNSRWRRAARPGRTGSVEDVECGGEVDGVHAGVERTGARMRQSFGLGAMARSMRDEGNKRTSMAARALATWNDVIECACRGICEHSRL